MVDKQKLDKLKRAAEKLIVAGNHFQASIDMLEGYNHGQDRVGAFAGSAGAEWVLNQFKYVISSTICSAVRALVCDTKKQSDSMSLPLMADEFELIPEYFHLAQYIRSRLSEVEKSAKRIAKFTDKSIAHVTYKFGDEGHRERYRVSLAEARQVKCAVHDCISSIASALLGSPPQGYPDCAWPTSDLVVLLLHDGLSDAAAAVLSSRKIVQS
jgi:hypothetical protein